jgi:hypothetical protein
LHIKYLVHYGEEYFTRKELEEKLYQLTHGTSLEYIKRFVQNMQAELYFSLLIAPTAEDYLGDKVFIDKVMQETKCSKEEAERLHDEIIHSGQWDELYVINVKQVTMLELKLNDNTPPQEQVNSFEPGTRVRVVRVLEHITERRDNIWGVEDCKKLVGLDGTVKTQWISGKMRVKFPPFQSAEFYPGELEEIPSNSDPIEKYRQETQKK